MHPKFGNRSVWF